MFTESKESQEFREICESICDFILDYCDGHLFPTLFLIEHTFTNISSNHLTSLSAFQQYLCLPEFENNEVLWNITDQKQWLTKVVHSFSVTKMRIPTSNL